MNFSKTNTENPKEIAEMLEALGFEKKEPGHIWGSDFATVSIFDSGEFYVYNVETNMGSHVPYPLRTVRQILKDRGYTLKNWALLIQARKIAKEVKEELKEETK